MVWKLEALTGEFNGQVITLADETLIGRHQDCTLVLQSAQVSRRHAAIVRNDGQFWLQDLNSSNGTFLNGERITTVELKDGDIIKIDQLEFKVLNEETQQADLEQIAEPVPSDEGMPSLAERAKDVAISPQGMPQNVSVPKPAPIPEGVNIQAQPEPTPVKLEEPVTRVAQEKEQEKNAAVGLISIVIIILLAIIAGIFFI